MKAYDSLTFPLTWLWSHQDPTKNPYGQHSETIRAQRQERPEEEHEGSPKGSSGQSVHQAITERFPSASMQTATAPIERST